MQELFSRTSTTKNTNTYYSRELKKLYPQYSTKQLYTFIAACFRFVVCVMKKTPEFKNDAVINFGYAFKFTFSYNKRNNRLVWIKRRGLNL
jgi:hypothetical protein